MKHNEKTLETIAERAAKISNDISEGVDGKESRLLLRQAIEWYASENCELHMEMSGLKAQLTWAKLCIACMMEAIDQRDSLSSRRANQIIRYARNCLDSNDKLESAQQASQTNGR